MNRVYELLAILGVSPDEVDLEQIQTFLSSEKQSFSEVLAKLRQPFPSELMEYHDKIKKESPFFSHEVYEKRIIDVQPSKVKFEIHDSDIKSVIIKNQEYHVATANCSLTIENWTYGALGTYNIRFLRDSPDTPTDLGAALKAAISNAFVGCCKKFYMSVEQIMMNKRGEIPPGDTLRESSSQVPTSNSTSFTGDLNELIGDICVVCKMPRTRFDVIECEKFNVSRIAYCKNHIPEHMKKKILNK